MNPRTLADLLENEYPNIAAGTPDHFGGQAALAAWIRSEIATRAEADAAVREWLIYHQKPPGLTPTIGMALKIRFATAAAWVRIAEKIHPSMDLTLEQVLIEAWPEMLFRQLRFLYAENRAFDLGRKDGSAKMFGA